MSQRTFVRAIALSAAGATALFAAPAAFAATGSAHTASARQITAAIARTESHALRGRSNIHGTTVESTNWSGYAATGSDGAYTSVSASWTQPSVTCSGRGDYYSAYWVGLDGYSNSALEQTGTEADCIGGTAEYGAWWEVLPAAETSYSNTVEPGDAMSASVTYNGNGDFTMTLSDATQNWTESTTHAGSSGYENSSAEVIAEAPEVNGSIAKLADFGSVDFTATDANGAAMSGDSPTAIEMVNSRGTDVRADPGAISSSGFVDTWEHSN